MSRLVIKFGGTSVGSADAITQALKDTELFSDRAFDPRNRFTRDAETWYRQRLEQVGERRKKAKAADRYFDDLVPDVQDQENGK